MSLIKLKTYWNYGVYIHPDFVSSISPYSGDIAAEGSVVYLLSGENYRISGDVDVVYSMIFGDARPKAPAIPTKAQRAGLPDRIMWPTLRTVRRP